MPTFFFFNKLRLFTSCSRAVSRWMGTAISSLAWMRSVVVYHLFHTFSPDLLNGSVTLLNRKTRSDHCSSQFFSQGHGSGTVWILTAAASTYGDVQGTQAQRLMLVRHSYCKNMGCFSFHQSYTKKSGIRVSLRNSRHTLSPWRLQCCTQLHGCPQVNICSCSFVGNHKEVQLLRQPYPSQYKRPWQGH